MKLLTILTSLFLAAGWAQPQRWPEKTANDWYARQPWLVGSNYIPATAINQLEMWQADTFDTVWMDTELGWAEGLGMNTMRVFLHDLLWKQDSSGFQHRLDRFLSMADKHHIKPVFVLFDSCWDPFPEMGQQRAPKPGVHNSGWVQSPGARALMDPKQHDRLREYVQGVLGIYRYDRRILAWDLWNEPDNTNDSSYQRLEPVNKVTGSGAAAQSVRVGAGGGAVTAPDQRRLEGRLARPCQTTADGENPDGAVGRDFLPQLRWPGGVRKARAVAAGVSPADSVHRVYGARPWQHVPGDAAHRQEVQGGGLQ